MRHRSISVLCTTLLTLIFSVAVANTQSENIQLARISSTLNAVYPLIDSAKNEAEVNHRTSFDYEALKRDIESIQNGISQKINLRDYQPRMVEPISAYYVNKQNVSLNKGAVNE